MEKEKRAFVGLGKASDGAERGSQRELGGPLQELGGPQRELRGPPRKQRGSQGIKEGFGGERKGERQKQTTQHFPAVVPQVIVHSSFAA